MTNSIKFDDSGLHEQQALSQNSKFFTTKDTKGFHKEHNTLVTKLCPLFFLVLFFLQYNIAQGQNFYGGVMAGINGCQVGGDGLSGYHKAGFFGGGFVGWRFTPMSALRMELEFSQKGSKETPTEENEHYYYRMHLNCIDLPLLYQLFFNIKNQKFAVEAGLSYTYVIGDPKEEGIDGTGFNYIVDGTGRPFTASSMNLVVGLYYHITQNFFVNLRTSNGITPIRKDPALKRHPLWGGGGQYNDVLTLSLGWDFGKGAIYE
ncbi:MAG: PorT family protein [Bacteroidales bacterium]|nr:PorT family protein [Bacteroidales bacterium]